MVVPQKQLDDLEEFHKLLNSAVTNIVERWWTDQEARFPERVPIERLEEGILRVGSDVLGFFLYSSNVGSGLMINLKI